MHRNLSNEMSSCYTICPSDSRMQSDPWSMPVGNAPSPPRPDLAACPRVALPYICSAIHTKDTHMRVCVRRRTHTHCLCDIHSVHIFSGLETHIMTSPNTHTHIHTLIHTNPRGCIVHWLGSYWGEWERDWWEERERDREGEMGTVRDRGLQR